MALFASLLPLLCWFAYNNGIFLVERRYPSMSSIMSQQRRRWVANAAIRETPVDAILAGNLMGSVSFLASTTALLVLASVAAFGQVTGGGPVTPRIARLWTDYARIKKRG